MHPGYHYDKNFPLYYQGHNSRNRNQEIRKVQHSRAISWKCKFLVTYKTIHFVYAQHDVFVKAEMP